MDLKASTGDKGQLLAGRPLISSLIAELEREDIR